MPLYKSCWQSMFGRGQRSFAMFSSILIGGPYEQWTRIGKGDSFFFSPSGRETERSPNEEGACWENDRLTNCVRTGGLQLVCFGGSWTGQKSETIISNVTWLPFLLKKKCVLPKQKIKKEMPSRLYVVIYACKWSHHPIWIWIGFLQSNF